MILWASVSVGTLLTVRAYVFDYVEPGVHRCTTFTPYEGAEHDPLSPKSRDLLSCFNPLCLKLGADVSRAAVTQPSTATYCYVLR